jgi:hypothetical protein
MRRIITVLLNLMLYVALRVPGMVVANAGFAMLIGCLLGLGCACQPERIDGYACQWRFCIANCVDGIAADVGAGIVCQFVGRICCACY